MTPKGGEKVDKQRLTQVGRAMKELGVEMIAAYSPQARGRSERSFGTWQGRLPQELRLAEISTVEGANAFLRDTRWQAARSPFTNTWTGSSIRYGPHVVGEFSVDGTATQTPDPKRRGKGASLEVGENQQQASSASHPRLGISPKARDSHFPTAPATTAFVLTKTKATPNQKPRLRRPDGHLTLFHKADRSRVNKSGHLDLLTTGAELSRLQLIEADLLGS